jgi:hypothetical protein
MGLFTLDQVDLMLAMSPSGKGAVVLLFTGIAAPLIGILLRRIAGGWDSIGKGPLAIEPRLPPTAPYLAPPNEEIDPETLEAEVRQMLEAKSERRRRRGQAPLDIEAEAARLLSTADQAGRQPVDFVGSR